MLATSAFITSIVTSLIIFLIIYFIYFLFSRRPSNAVIYYPGRILSGIGMPDFTRRGAFQWMRDLWHVNEDELTGIAGLDAAVYIRFQTTCLHIFLWAGLYCVPVIIAVAATDDYYVDYNSKQTDPKLMLAYSDIDKVAMGNISPKTNRLWAGVIGAYWVTIVTIFILLKTYGDVVKLRARHFGNKDSPLAPEQYAALARDIPQAETGKASESQVNEFFSRIHGPYYLGSTLVPCLKKVTGASQDLIQMRKKLAHTQGAYGLSKTEALPEGKRPQTRTGFLGLIGPKVDAIEWYHEKVAELESKLREEQLTATSKQGDAAIIFFSRRQQAAAAAQSMHAENADEWQVSPAPEPRDVQWSNLRLQTYERLVRQLAIYGLVFLTIVFYMIPIAFISSLTTLENLQKTLPFMESIVELAALKTVLQAYLPQLALIVFLAILPAFLTFLSTMEGIPSKSHISRAASGKYFYFIVFNVFLGVTLSSSLFNSLEQLIEDPTSIVDTLGSSLPQQASFFISFISLKFLVGSGLELSRLVPYVMYSIKKKYLCKTEHEVVEAWAPGMLNYVNLVPDDLLIFTLGVCYAVIAPLILPFVIAYFSFNWAIMKNQVINVYVADWESQGRMWPHMHNRMVAALLLSQLTMLGFFAIKKFIATAVLIPLPILTIIYFFVIHGRYYRTFQVSSLDVASRDAPEEAPTVDALKQAYLVDPLQPPEQVGIVPGVGTLPTNPADKDAKVRSLLAMEEDHANDQKDSEV